MLIKLGLSVKADIKNKKLIPDVLISCTPPQTLLRKLGKLDFQVRSSSVMFSDKVWCFCGDNNSGGSEQLDQTLCGLISLL